MLDPKDFIPATAKEVKLNQPYYSLSDKGEYFRFTIDTENLRDEGTKVFVKEWLVGLENRKALFKKRDVNKTLEHI